MGNRDWRLNHLSFYFLLFLFHFLPREESLRPASLASSEPAKGGQVRVQQGGRTLEQGGGVGEGGGEDVPC